MKRLIRNGKVLYQGELQELEVLFDEKGALENVTRFVNGLGYKTEVVKDGPDFKLVMKK